MHMHRSARACRPLGHARQLLDGRRLIVHELEVGVHALLRRVSAATLLPAARALPARRRAARLPPPPPPPYELSGAIHGENTRK